jgi:hypothetical protein
MRMSVTNETKRTGYYKELSPEKRKEYLGLKREKFLPNNDNIYFSVFIAGDKKELEAGNGLLRLLEHLEKKKEEAIKNHTPVEFSNGLSAGSKTLDMDEDFDVAKKGYTFYGYCLTEPDLYDIFICKTLPNDDTPRIVVQLRAQGLWTRGEETLLLEAYSRLEKLLAGYGCTIAMCRESRIDYCYHTNAISNIDNLLIEKKGYVRNMHTNLSAATMVADIEHLDDGTKLHKDYLCFGKKESNNVRARIYDKVKEVIEMGYKDFFFKIWYDNGLISYYDKWCMEYAFPYRNTDYLYKAAVAFYAEHDDDSKWKLPPEYLSKCLKALNSKNTSLADFKKLAREHMPKVTSILNIEYETKRKFYYYSDPLIDNFKTLKRDIPMPLERIYKILDNKRIFLDYLTEKTLSFYSGKDADGEPKYLAWWQRLRNTKLGGIKADAKLLRDYSYEMDIKCVQRRAISAVASSAVYEDKVETGFVEDISDFLANLTDNDVVKREIRKVLFYCVEDGDISAGMVRDYQLTKAKKDRLLKNRKKRRSNNHDD